MAEASNHAELFIKNKNKNKTLAIITSKARNSNNQGHSSVKKKKLKKSQAINNCRTGALAMNSYWDGWQVYLHEYNKEIQIVI